MIPIAIVSSILTARVLGPEVKGLFTLFLTTQGILLLPGAAISAALIHFVASRRPAPGKLKILINLLVLIQAVVSVGALALLIQIRGVRTVLLGGLDSIYLLAVFLVVCANLWLTYRLAILSGLQMYSKSVALGTIASIVNSILFVSVVAYWWIEKINPPLTWVVILSVCASLFSAAFLGIGATHVRAIEGAILGSRTVLLALGSFAAPVFLRGLIEWVNFRVDVYFVYAFSGARELGVYTVAVGLAQQLWLIPVALSGPLFARVSHEGDGTRSRELIQYAFRATSLISVTLGLCMAIVAPILLPIAFGSQFSGAVLLFLVLLPGAIALGPTRVIISYFSGRGRPRESLKAECLGLGATVTLDILLIPSLGALGAACASCVAYILYSVYVCRRFVALTESRWSELLVPRRDDLRKIWRGLGDQKRSFERSRSAARLFSFLGFKRA